MLRMWKDPFTRFHVRTLLNCLYRYIEYNSVSNLRIFTQKRACTCFIFALKYYHTAGGPKEEINVPQVFFKAFKVSISPKSSKSPCNLERYSKVPKRLEFHQSRKSNIPIKNTKVQKVAEVLDTLMKSRILWSPRNLKNSKSLKVLPKVQVGSMPSGLRSI